MARARLHLICGNCGCNDEWQWEHIEKTVDDNAVKSFIRVIAENTNYALVEKHQFDISDKSTHPKKKGYYQTNHCVALYEDSFGFHIENNDGYTEINQYVSHWCELPTFKEN